MQRLKSDGSGSKSQLCHTQDLGQVTETFHALAQRPASGLGDDRDQTGPRTADLQSQISITDLVDMPFGFQVTQGGSFLMTLSPTNLSNAQT